MTTTCHKVLAFTRFVPVLAMVLALAVGQAYAQAQAPAAAPAAPGAAAPAPGATAAPAGGQAAAPAAPEQRGSQPGQKFVSVQFVLEDQLSYVQHPFYQLTQNTFFKNGHSATGNSYSFARATSTVDEDYLTSIYRAVPSFGIEVGQTLAVAFPRALSFGYDHIHLAQTDRQALNTNKEEVTIPRVNMDAYYDMASFRIFAFDLGTPGLNYFLGIGLGVVNGVIEARPYEGANTQKVLFAQFPFGVTRFGVEARGDNFGFRYEVNFVNADKVTFSKNPFLNQTQTSIDHSGVLIRVSVTYQFSQR